MPGKNIRLLGGKPLIAYSIESALACPLVSRVVVSTENRAIADVAVEYGADVPFLRPEHLAGDRADLGIAINDLLFQLKCQGYDPPAHIVMLPTSPFRTQGLLDLLCGELIAGRHSVRTVQAFTPHPLFTLGKTGVLRPSCPEDISIPGLTLFKSIGLLGGVNRYGRLSSYAHRVEDQIMRIDLDTPRDFQAAEAVLRAGAFNFNSRDASHG